MVSSTKITFDQSAITRLLSGTTDAASKRAAGRVADRANRNVVAKGRVRTGALSRSYRATKVSSGTTSATYEVGSPLGYASFQEDGIGPVHARPGGVLRFMPKGSSVFIFRPRTRGFSGAHQLRDAMAALTERDFLE